MHTSSKEQLDPLEQELIVIHYSRLTFKWWQQNQVLVHVYTVYEDLLIHLNCGLSFTSE